jgi:hypothetical protein
MARMLELVLSLSILMSMISNQEITMTFVKP